MPRARALITTAVTAAALLACSGVASAGTVSLWHMDETSGTTMVDSVGHNDGTLYHVGLGQPGFLGTAYAFNGTDSLVTGPAGGGLNAGSSAFWYGAHVRFAHPPSASVVDFDLLRKGLATEPGGFWKIELFPSGQAHCEMKGSSSSAGLTAGPDIADNRWHTVFCLKDATTMKVIVDGGVVGTATVTLGSFGNSAVLAIGAKAEGGDQYAGLMDEAAFGTGTTITNVAAPAVGGSPGIGATLTAAPGRWDGLPDFSYLYQWQRCAADGGSCAPIGGAAQSTYAVTDADAGRTLRVTVTAVDALDHASATSAASAVVPVPRTTPPPAPPSGGAPGTTPVGGAGHPSAGPQPSASCLQITAPKRVRRVTLSRGRAMTLRFDATTATLRFTAPRHTIRSVAFTLDGRRIARVRGGSLRRVLDAAGLAMGDHVLRAIVLPRHGRARTLTLRVTVAAC